MPDPAGTAAPSALWLEATDSHGRLASWWSPGWWSGYVASWGSATLRLVLLPTPGAVLLRPVIEELERIAVGAKKWRLVAQTRGDGLTSTAAVDRLLRSPYHDVEFLAGDEVVASQGRGSAAVHAQRVLAVMKQIVELREARRLKRPAVIWLWDAKPAVGGPDRLAAARALARQLQVDRLVVPER